MLKTILMITGILAISVAAHADKAGSVTCSTSEKAQFHYTLEAKTLQMMGDEGARFVDVTMNAWDDQATKETGRTKYLSGAKNPKARKYKAFFWFKMENLTDTSDFSKFLPIDQCEINVYIPEDFPTKKSFKAPVVTHCDQNGGSVTMACEYKPERE